MYLEFYGLQQEPFRLTPDPQFFYLSENHNKGLGHLLYGVNNRKGFIALTGEVGAGKTTLCRLLLKQLDENVSIAIILNSLVDGLTFLKQINRDFAIPYESDSQDELVGHLYDFLIEEKKRERNVVVIVDECQNLKFEVLETIRMLSNLETEKDKLLQILLIGQPEFVDMLNSYELRQLNQRIMVRVHIAALSLKEMEQYIYHRLSVAGNENAVKLTKGALKKIYRFSQGIPRKINVISEYALLAGYVENTHKITSGSVKKALKDIEVKRELSIEEKMERNKRIFLKVRKFFLAASIVFLLVYYKNPLRVSFANFVELFQPMDVESVEENKTTQFPQKLPIEKETGFSKSPVNIDKPLEELPQELKEKTLSADSLAEQVESSSEKPDNKSDSIGPVEEKTDLENKMTEERTEDSKDAEQSDESTQPGSVTEETAPIPETNATSLEKEVPDTNASSTHALSPAELQNTSHSTSPAAAHFFEALDEREKGIWLLLSTWGIEISHPRRTAYGEIIPLEKQLERFNFVLFQTWADFELLKKMNLPCAVGVLENGMIRYWVVNGVKDKWIRLYRGPEDMMVMNEKDFYSVWQGDSFLLVEKGVNTLEGSEALYKGQESPEIVRLKEILFRMGLFGDDPTPVFDLSLEKAVQNFQIIHDLTPDGIIGVEAKLIFYSRLTKNIPRLLTVPQGKES